MYAGCLPTMAQVLHMLMYFNMFIYVCNIYSIWIQFPLYLFINYVYRLHKIAYA